MTMLELHVAGVRDLTGLFDVPLEPRQVRALSFKNAAHGVLLAEVLDELDQRDDRASRRLRNALHRVFLRSEAGAFVSRVRQVASGWLPGRARRSERL